MGIPFPIAQLTVAVTDIAMNLWEKRGLVPAEHFEGPVLGLFFLPKRVPLMVGPPRYKAIFSTCIAVGLLQA